MSANPVTQVQSVQQKIITMPLGEFLRHAGITEPDTWCCSNSAKHVIIKVERAGENPLFHVESPNPAMTGFDVYAKDGQQFIKDCTTGQAWQMVPVA